MSLLVSSPRQLRVLAACLLALSALAACAESSSALSLGPGDLRIEQLPDGGYHLYVRAKKGLGSILLTESTKDPGEKTDSFAYRALEKNSINGDEKRVLDGKTLISSSPQYFLVDSSPEPDAAFGSAFHVFIPWVVAWGYPWSRSGQSFIHDGSFVNIRAFAKRYADYSGPYADNPYLVRVSQARAAQAQALPPAPAPAPAPASAPPASVPAVAARASAEDRAMAKPNAKLYIPETLAAFGAIASSSKGELAYASSDKDIAERIDAILAGYRGKSLDLVLCIDATDTMIGALSELRARLPGLIGRRLADFPSYRLGIVSYKDYFEEYLYKRFDFTRDPKTFAADLEAINGGGGRDVPEAVYEALSAALSEFPWQAESRLVILVGDAPPHPLPRGSVSAADVTEEAVSEGVVIDAVAVPK